MMTKHTHGVHYIGPSYAFHKNFFCRCGKRLSTNDVMSCFKRLSSENEMLQRWKQVVIEHYNGSPEPHEPEGWTIIKNKVIWALLTEGNNEDN